jgi:hypothetical protein
LVCQARITAARPERANHLIARCAAENVLFLRDVSRAPFA